MLVLQALAYLLIRSASLSFLQYYPRVGGDNAGAASVPAAPSAASQAGTQQTDAPASTPSSLILSNK